MLSLAGCSDQSTMTSESRQSAWQQFLSFFLPEPPNTVAQLETLAAQLQAQGQMPLAEQYYRQALTLREYAWGFEHPHVVPGLDKLAEFSTTQGKHAEAEALRQRALAIRAKPPGGLPQTPRTAHP
jgi:hypothetical protein